MRVLVLTTSVETTGGVQYASRMMVRALYDTFGPDAQISLVTITDSAINTNRLAVPVEAIGGGGSRWRTAVSVMRRWLFQEWDLILFAHVNFAALATLARLFRRAPILAWIYSMEAWLPIDGLRQRGMLRIDKMLYDSAHARDRSYTANPWLRRLDDGICHLGLMPPTETDSDYTAMRIEEPFALIIGRISSVERYKGHEEMIRVWADVARQRPTLSLVVIGDGDDRPRLELLAKTLGVKVKFLGAIEDRVRDDCLRRCRCFCMPSSAEGFGLVYLEAMRESKAVLAGRLDAGREVVIDGVTGRTVDASLPAELLDGILEVSGPRAEELGAAGRKRYEEQFDYIHFRRRFAAEVRDLIDRRKSNP